MESYHIYTDKNYVLRTLKPKKWDRLDLLVFNDSKSKKAFRPSSYEELVNLLKDYDKVYRFTKWQPLKHGAYVYDITIEE